MTPEQFLAFSRVLPEPMLLVTGEGNIIAVNRPAATLMGSSSKELQGKNLLELVTEASEKVLSYLKACSRSRQLVIGALSFALGEGQVLQCRAEGAVVQPASADSPALNLLRLENRAKANSEFMVLNQKIDELTQEIHQRQKAEFALLRNNEELQVALQQLKATQLQLIQTEKMSSLGQLVAGIAHEINNPVNFINGNLIYAEQYIEDLVELLKVYQQEYPVPPAKVKEKIEEIELNFILEDLHKLLKSMQLGADRICDIVKSLRNFSRLDEAELKIVDIHEGIESTLVILQNRLKPKSDYPGIEVIKDYRFLPKLECYPGQLNQVFINIINNAIDALEERDQHRTPEERRTNPSLIQISTEKLENEHVLVRIADNGSGIPDEICQQIFNPFFTTKPIGKGTGLGLSISYKIITDAHRGQLRCCSKLGQGTEFLIEIPIYQKISEKPKKLAYNNLIPLSA